MKELAGERDGGNLSQRGSVRQSYEYVNPYDERPAQSKRAKNMMEYEEK